MGFLSSIAGFFGETLLLEPLVLLQQVCLGRRAQVIEMSNKLL